MRFVGLMLMVAVGLHAQDEALIMPDLPVDVVENPETFLVDPAVEESAPVAAVTEPTRSSKRRAGCKNCKPRKKNMKVVTEGTAPEIAK